MQGFKELSYLKVPSFPELLVYGLIGCHHDEAWDHEIKSGQSKKECDIVSGKGEEGRKKEGVNSTLVHLCKLAVSIFQVLILKLLKPLLLGAAFAKAQLSCAMLLCVG